MIKKFDKKDIALILDLDDGFEGTFPYCNKAEWVQKLLKISDLPEVFIYGDIEGNTINSYGVAVDAYHPPLSYQVSILFFYSKNNDIKSNIELKQMLDTWAKQRGAREVTFLCNDLKVFEKYGAKQKGIFAGWDL